MHGVEAFIFRLKKAHEASLQLFESNRENGEKISMGDTRRTRQYRQVRCLLGHSGPSASATLFAYVSSVRLDLFM
jgi:hypothetical protein